MRLEGQSEIAARRARVWAALIDPRRVAACIPGNPAVEVVDATHFRTKVAVGSGFLRTTALIEIHLRDLLEPSKIGAAARGSAMGGGASAVVAGELDEVAPALTRLRWAAEVTLTGMAAGFAGMVEGPAGSAIADTLACLKAKLEAEEAAEGGPTAEAAADAAPVETSPAGDAGSGGTEAS